jgi:hypothetical protein
MKFFTQISNSHFHWWAFLDDVLNILEPSLLRYFLYSTHHNLLPKSDVLSISVSTLETHFEEVGKYDLLTFSQEYLYSLTVDTQYGDEHGLYSQRLSRSEHSHYYIFGLSNLESAFEYHLVEHDNDILLTRLDEHLNDLHYGCFFDNHPYCKTRNFIETKSNCNEIAGF